MSFQRVNAVYDAAQGRVPWTGELTHQDIRELRMRGADVKLVGVLPSGSVVCEVSVRVEAKDFEQ